MVPRLAPAWNGSGAQSNARSGQGSDSCRSAHRVCAFGTSRQARSMATLMTWSRSIEAEPGGFAVDVERELRMDGSRCSVIIVRSSSGWCASRGERRSAKADVVLVPTQAPRLSLFPPSLPYPCPPALLARSAGGGVWASTTRGRSQAQGAGRWVEVRCSSSCGPRSWGAARRRVGVREVGGVRRCGTWRQSSPPRRPSSVRVAISERSNSAMPPNTVSTMRPAGVVVSAQGAPSPG